MITAEEKARRADVVRESIHSVELEGLTVSPEQMKIFDAYIEGSITLEEVSIQSKALHEQG